MAAASLLLLKALFSGFERSLFGKTSYRMSHYKSYPEQAGTTKFSTLRDASLRA